MSKRAWEYGREIIERERPFPERAGRVQWEDVIRDGRRDLDNMKYLWGGNVTESLMPLFFIAVYIQEYGNLGYDVREAEAMIEEGRELARTKNDIALYRHTCRLFKMLYDSPKKEDHTHWKYTEYNSFEQYAASVEFPKYVPYTPDRVELFDKIYAGWIAQVCAGAVGTAIEGYHTKALEEVYGTVDRYIKDPEMYNDDLTFELAFLETFIRKGYDLTAADVAEDWAARLPFAFTAEGIALKNIKNGIYPPESGKFRNPLGFLSRGTFLGQGKSFFCLLTAVSVLFLGRGRGRGGRATAKADGSRRTSADGFAAKMERTKAGGRIAKSCSPFSAAKWRRQKSRRSRA